MFRIAVDDAEIRRRLDRGLHELASADARHRRRHGRSDAFVFA